MSSNTNDLSAAVIAAVIAAALIGLASGCNAPGTPACNDCSPTTNPTPFTAGNLPNSATALDGDRCGATGSRLFVFNNLLLGARLADSTTNTLTFARNEPFLIYWSVCNVGAATSQAITVPQGLAVFGPGGFAQTTSYSIPALASCQCVTPIPQVQFPTGLATAGSYTATLVGMFNTQARLTITP